MLRRAFVLFLIAAALTLGGGCKSSTGPVDEGGFVGTWRATKAEFVSLADPNTKADIVAQGSTVTLVFEPSTATLTIADPGQNPQVLEANWTASIDILTLTWTSGANGESQFDYVLNGDHLSMAGGHMPFDFTPGNFVEAVLSVTLVRQ